MTWRFDTKKTESRYQTLQRYYSSQSINADSFACRFFGACAASQKTEAVKQYAGGTAGLMPFYDTHVNGRELRVMVIGKECGYMQGRPFGTSSNFDENSLNLLNCINWKRKNNHIRGTLITLQRIFGVDTEYIYASYAMTDALRCAFQAPDRRGSLNAVLDTPTMRRNCLGYLIQEIRILEPTLIIVQGEWAIKDRRQPFVVRLGEALGQAARLLKPSRSGLYGLFAVGDIMCVVSHHPAILGHWLANLAPDSLWPMLTYLRDIQFLPEVGPEAASDYEKLVKPVVDPILLNLPSNDRLRSCEVNGDTQLGLF